jgi:outer membrane protein assembly factor BamB
MSRGFIASFVSILLLAATVRADDWPQWLGPKRDGVWRETGILDKFPKDGPKVHWRKEIGPGYTGPAVVEGRVYVMDRQAAKDDKGKPLPSKNGVIQGTERVLCLSAKDGSLLWKDEYDCPYKIYYPEGPRTTPLFHKGKLYTLGAMGHLRCHDAKTGKVDWSKDLLALYKTKPPVWGYASHLLVDGDRLISLAGGKGSAVVSFNKDTGRELWKALDAEEVGYSPPTLCEAGGTKQLIVWLDTAIHGLNPETGESYWSKPYPANGKPRRPAVPIATPVKAGDKLFVTAFYNGGLMLQFKADKPDVTELWRGKSDNPEKPDTLNTTMTTPVIKDGHIYGMCGNGQLRCLKVDTGKQVWESLKVINGKKALFGTAFFIRHGDRFFVFNEQGDLIIARLTPKGYDEIDRTHLLEPTLSTAGRSVVWSCPAFAEKCMFARNDKEIICVSLAAKEKS